MLYARYGFVKNNVFTYAQLRAAAAAAAAGLAPTAAVVDIEHLLHDG